MGWVVEQPWLILLLGALLQALLFWGLVRTGKKPILWVMLAAALLFAGWLGLERAIVTEREQVRNVLFATAKAIEDGDEQMALAHISASAPSSGDVTGFGGNFATMRDEVSHWMRDFAVETVSIKRNLEITVHADQTPPMAEATFNATAMGRMKTTDGMSGKYAAKFVVQFRKETDGQWRIRRYTAKLPTE
jgi:hypothetical protein